MAYSLNPYSLSVAAPPHTSIILTDPEYQSAAVHMTAPRQFTLSALPKAWTPGTDGPVEGEAMLLVVKTQADLDVTAAITNLTSTCSEDVERVYSEASFDVVARRSDVRGARTVELPYFSTVLRGGSAVVTKRVGTVTLNFADGQERASASAKAGAFVNRADATLPADVRERITRKREPGDPDAALDPLADPEVRAAVQRATFELLVGFQLTEDQLRYNVTR